MGAALYMALSRTLVRTYATDYADAPEQVLRAASARMLSDAGAGMFVTVFYGILDPAVAGWCTATPATTALPGQRQAATAIRPLGRTGMASAWSKALPGTRKGAHRPRRLLLLYTTVWSRRRTGEGAVWPRPAAGGNPAAGGQPAAETQAAILAALHDFSGSEAQFDDITLVVVHREPQTPERRSERGATTRRLPGRAAL